MTRLPTPGSDNGNWGSILNDFLEVAHAADGSLNPNTIANAQVTASANIAPTKIAGTAEVQTNKGQPNGYAALDTNSTVLGNIPSYL